MLTDSIRKNLNFAEKDAVKFSFSRWLLSPKGSVGRARRQFLRRPLGMSTRRPLLTGYGFACQKCLTMPRQRHCSAFPGHE